MPTHAEVIAQDAARLRALLVERGIAPLQPVVLEADTSDEVRAFWETLGWSETFGTCQLVHPARASGLERTKARLAEWRRNGMAKLRLEDLPKRFRMIDDDGAGVGFGIADETTGKGDPRVLAVLCDLSAVRRTKLSYTATLTERLTRRLLQPKPPPAPPIAPLTLDDAGRAAAAEGLATIARELGLAPPPEPPDLTEAGVLAALLECSKGRTARCSFTHDHVPTRASPPVLDAFRLRVTRLADGVLHFAYSGNILFRDTMAYAKYLLSVAEEHVGCYGPPAAATTFAAPAPKKKLPKSDEHPFAPAALRAFGFHAGPKISSTSTGRDWIGVGIVDGVALWVVQDSVAKRKQPPVFACAEEDRNKAMAWVSTAVRW